MGNSAHEPRDVGEAITGHGRLETAVMRHDPKNFKVQHKAVYAYLCAMCGNKKHAWPTQLTISKHLGISRRMVIQAIKKLESLGILVKSKRYPHSLLSRNLKYEIKRIPAIKRP